MKVFYTDKTGKVTGPIPRDQLQMMFDSGIANDIDQVCEEGGQDWVPLLTFLRSAPTPSPLPTENSTSLVDAASEGPPLDYNYRGPVSAMVETLTSTSLEDDAKLGFISRAGTFSFKGSNKSYSFDEFVVEFAARKKETIAKQVALEEQERVQRAKREE